MERPRPSSAPPRPKGNELTPRHAYNIATDLAGAGVNIRPKDNLLQALAIGVCLMLGATIGAVVAWWMRAPILAGVFVGGFVGVLVGLFANAGSSFFDLE